MPKQRTPLANGACATSASKVEPVTLDVAMSPCVSTLHVQHAHNILGEVTQVILRGKQNSSASASQTYAVGGLTELTATKHSLHTSFTQDRATTISSLSPPPPTRVSKRRLHDFKTPMPCSSSDASPSTCSSLVKPARRHATALCWQGGNEFRPALRYASLPMAGRAGTEVFIRTCEENPHGWPRQRDGNVHPVCHRDVRQLYHVADACCLSRTVCESISEQYRPLVIGHVRAH